MLELYISSSIKTTPILIAKKLCKEDVECQIYNNHSTMVLNDKNIVEEGYYIKIFNVENIDFKEKVWEVLSEYLNLKCAYIIANEYKGCILNWPTVFTESNCNMPPIKIVGVGKKRKRKCK